MNRVFAMRLAFVGIAAGLLTIALQAGDAPNALTKLQGVWLATNRTVTGKNRFDDDGSFYFWRRELERRARVGVEREILSHRGLLLPICPLCPRCSTTLHESS